MGDFLPNSGQGNWPRWPHGPGCAFSSEVWAAAPRALPISFEILSPLFSQPLEWVLLLEVILSVLCQVSLFTFLFLQYLLNSLR